MADLRAAVKLSTYHREKALHAINLMFHIFYYKLSKECHLLYEGSPQLPTQEFLGELILHPSPQTPSQPKTTFLSQA